ncbi:hypothetical protein psyc5s11_31520 [Clostridium gelidum]|uniref:Glucose-1-phosphate thymidylyltransferase n=1 Tax=Clostridium gelidum TaxID=704125 RepID=A0ABM7TDC3_9CLOT|nr:hypothetical protein psyc5s11_31520 [Clostridium gelidum]
MIIYYPMSVLMIAVIRDILIISTPRDIINFKDGQDLGLNIEYAVQENPNGLAEAFIIGEEFIDKDNVVMVLGDNIFYRKSFSEHLRKAANLKSGAYIFGYYVQNPKDFWGVEFYDKGNVISLEEKYEKPKSKYVVQGHISMKNKNLQKRTQKTSYLKNKITDLYY